MAYTWLDTEVLSVDNVSTEAPAPYDVGDPLLRRPRHQASLAVSWSSASGQAFFTINGRGGMTGTSNPISRRPCTRILDMPTRRSAVPSASPVISSSSAVSTNLFDRDYEEAFGFPALGGAP